MRLELTNTGFAIRRLGRLATRANWNGRRDSNSRIEFGRLACFQIHHFRERRELRQLAPWLWGEILFRMRRLTTCATFGTPGRTRTRNLDVRSVALFQLSYRSVKGFGASYRIRTGVSALATPCLEPTGPTMRIWSGRTELNCHHEFPGLGCCVTPHPEMNWCAR